MTDRAFMKFFSTLLAALVAFTVVLFIIAQVIGGKTKSPDVAATADAKTVAERIKPVGEVSVKTNPVMDTLIPTAKAAGVGKGKAAYDANCAACHTAGVAFAPKLGDKAAWKARISKGSGTLYQNAIKGFKGKKGFMPAKGGNAGLAEVDVKAAVDYMVLQAK